jgi:nitrate reductase NapE component
MRQRLAQIVSSSLTLPLWLAIAVAMAGGLGLIVLDALGTL